MELSPEHLVSSIKVGTICYFSSVEINTDIPHFFICVYTKANEFVIFTCCTSKGGKRERVILKTQDNLATLVYIKPSDENPFSEDTYIDCNSCFYYESSKLKTMFDKGLIRFRGEVSDINLSQIYYGMNASDLIEEEVKDLIKDLI